MKIHLLSCGFILGVFAALACTQALSQDAQPPADAQAAAQDWMQLIRPGRFHGAMEPSIGAWETTTKIWVAGPENEPVVTQGRAERKWILGGRFVMEELTTEFPLAAISGGQAENIPWSGMGLFGYDNFRNMYVGCWADTMGTQLLTMKGSVSPDGAIFTYFGEMDEPGLGVIGRTVKYQTKIVDADTHVFSIYDLHAGTDYRVVEVTYKRKKAEQSE